MLSLRDRNTHLANQVYDAQDLKKKGERENEKHYMQIVMYQQKMVSTIKFRDDRDIQIFQSDMSTAALSRRGWFDLLQCPTSSGLFRNVVYEFNRITTL